MLFDALVIDKMTLHQHLEYDSSTGKYCGQVNMGSEMHNSFEVANNTKFS